MAIEIITTDIATQELFGLKSYAELAANCRRGYVPPLSNFRSKRDACAVEMIRAALEVEGYEIK